jgi:flagellar basal-body rod protein FlgF
MSSLKAISSSLNALTREYETITNNLANVDTPGFKRQYNNFAKSLNAAMQTELDVKSAYDFKQGGLVETGNHLDMAIGGKGFFTVETADGPLYTRCGLFQINSKGQIVDLDGRLIGGKEGPLVIPAEQGISDITVSEDGFIKAGANTVGQLKLVDFGADELKLLPAGKNCWSAPKDLEPKEASAISVKQGYREASNVAIVDELVDMIAVSRLYQSSLKALTADQDNGKSILNVAMG